MNFGSFFNAATRSAQWEARARTKHTELGQKLQRKQEVLNSLLEVIKELTTAEAKAAEVYYHAAEGSKKEIKARDKRDFNAELRGRLQTVLESVNEDFKALHSEWVDIKSAAIQEEAREEVREASENND